MAAALILGASARSAAQEQPTPPPSIPDGRVQCVVFSEVGLGLMAGVVVSVDGGPSAVTGPRGSAFMMVPPGTHALTIAVPPEQLSGKKVAGQGIIHIVNVGVAAGTPTRVLVTVAADGSLAGADLFIPKAAAEAPAAVPSAESAPGEQPEEAEVEAVPAPQDEIGLPPGDYDEYVVRGRRIRGSVASVMEERRAATSVTDAIGAEDIRKSADGTASAATRRVVGATVVGGQYLFVRGLGGRYSNVRLNEVPLPSTDPDVPGFQLDLFPASLLSSLTIAKTFTPDMPGDFAGGSMNIGTRDFPEKLDLSASISLSGDTRTLGKKVPTYDGGNLDFLGFDDGTRSMPKDIPDQSLAFLDSRNALKAGYSEEERTRLIEDASKSFPNHWKLLSTTGLPQLGLGFSVGNTLHLGGHRAGYLFTLGYRFNTQFIDERLVNLHGGQNHVVEPAQTLDRHIGTEEAQIGALGSISYDLAEGHQLRAVSLLTQTGDDKTSLVTGITNNEDQPVRQLEYRFTERRLLFNQLLGTHDLSPATLDWQLNMALVDRTQPDARSVLYLRKQMDEEFYYASMGGSGEHAYSDLGQLDFGGGTNFTLPIDRSKLKIGYLGRISNRDLSARRFDADYKGKQSAGRYAAPEDLLSPDNVPDLWVSTEETSSSDGYDAKQLLNAGYGLGEIAIASWLKLTGGARLEAFHQNIDTVAPAESATGGDVPTVKKTNVDALPSAGAIFALTDSMNVRLAYGGTVARPLLRELSPAVAQDFVRRRTTQGSPDLKRTYIQNFDMRWELFPGQTEVLAASVFYKHFKDAIETIIEDDNGNLSYENTKAAYDYGVELEARFGLGRLTSLLEDMVFGANFAAIKSQVELSEVQAKNATSQKRALSGQSPYVVNLTLGYSPEGTGLSLNAFYNVFGRRIQEVGKKPYPDVYEEPFHSLDFTASYQLSEHWTLGATATNLLFRDAVIHQGKYEFSHIKKGSTFGLRLGFAN